MRSSARALSWLRPALFIAAVLVLGLPSLLFPFGFDQSNHAFIAWRCLEGARLYTDVFSLKPPLTTLIHGTSQLAFGHHMGAIRVVDLGWTVATALAVVHFVRVAFPGCARWLAPASGLGYALLYNTLSYWHMAQTDPWANLPITLALAFGCTTARATGPLARWHGLAAGACVALAIGLKYTFAPVLGPVLLVAWFGANQARRVRVERGLWVMAGMALGLGVIGVGMALAGAWEGFVGSHLPAVFSYGDYPTDEPGAGAPVGFFARLLQRLDDLGPALYMVERAPGAWKIALLSALVSPVLLYRYRRDPRVAFGLLATIAWFGCAWGSLAVQGRFFAYQFGPLLAPLSVLVTVSGALLIGWLARMLRGRDWTPVLVGAFAVMFWMTTLDGVRPNYSSPIYEYQALLAAAGPGATLDKHWGSKHFLMTPLFRVGDHLELARMVRSRVRPGDQMFVWGTATSPYFLTGLAPPTIAYTSVQALGLIGADTSYDAWFDALQQSPPRFFVLQSGDRIPHVLPGFRGSLEDLPSAPGLVAWLRARYRRIGVVESMQLLERL